MCTHYLVAGFSEKFLSQFLTKLNVPITWPSHLLPRYLPKRNANISFTTVKIWNCHREVDSQNAVYIHRMKYYSAMSTNRLLSHVTTWKNFIVIIAVKWNHTYRTTWYMTPFTYNFIRFQLMYRTKLRSMVAWGWEKIGSRRDMRKFLEVKNMFFVISVVAMISWVYTAVEFIEFSS
jgi:hypothetical protein